VKKIFMKKPLNSYFFTFFKIKTKNVCTQFNSGKNRTKIKKGQNKEIFV